MSKNRNNKIITIIALMVAVAGLTLGFAAFSRVLTISSSATVNPNDADFKTTFSSSNTEVVSGNISGEATGGAEAGVATINGTTISNLTAKFSGPGQTVKYTFYENNSGNYDAYLTNATFNTVAGSDPESNKVCTRVTTGLTEDEYATEELVTAACNAISIKVDVGSTLTLTDTTEINTHTLQKGAYTPIVVTITYDSNGSRADGPFDVSFGNITMTYSSADPNA